MTETVRDGSKDEGEGQDEEDSHFVLKSHYETNYETPDVKIVFTPLT